MPAIFVVVTLALFGAGLVITGTYIIFGFGVSLLVSGALFFAAAVFLRSGIMPNG